MCLCLCSSFFGAFVFYSVDLEVVLLFGSDQFCFWILIINLMLTCNATVVFKLSMFIASFTMERMYFGAVQGSATFPFLSKYALSFLGLQCFCWFFHYILTNLAFDFERCLSLGGFNLCLALLRLLQLLSFPLM